MGQGAVRKVCVGKVSPTMSIGKCYCVVGTRDDQLAQCGSIAQSMDAREYQTLHSTLYDSTDSCSGQGMCSMEGGDGKQSRI